MQAVENLKDMTYLLPMKKIISLFAFFAVLLLGCQNQAPTSFKTGPAAPKNAPTAKPGEDLVGDWLEQDLSRPIAQENVEILTSIMSKTHPDVTITQVRGVWTQVVAGYNARIVADYKKGGTTGILTAILYQDLAGNVFLKSVEL